MGTAGHEENLYAHFCSRCGDEMLHLCQIEGEFPLCILWQLTCGECGSQLQAWEEVSEPLRMGGMGHVDEDLPDEGEEYEPEPTGAEDPSTGEDH